MLEHLFLINAAEEDEQPGRAFGAVTDQSPDSPRHGHVSFIPTDQLALSTQKQIAERMQRRASNNIYTAVESALRKERAKMKSGGTSKDEL
jgi:hypothetical protein